MKYYAVKKGNKPGIYETWNDCKKQTYKYSGAVFKSFDSLEEAEQYLNEGEEKTINSGLPFAYIDGSFSKTKELYSYGGFINNGGDIHIIQGTGDRQDFLQYRNITGEVRGVLAVIQQALKMGIREINLYYDYSGLECWISGAWRCENELSRFYRDYVLRHSERVKLNFIHVDGHTGIEGNEMADYLAKEAAGVKLRKKDIEAIKAFREEAAAHQPEAGEKQQ